MKSKQQNTVNIREWSDSDLPLLERLMGDPIMTVYLGGPESAEQIHKRHKTYCQLRDSGKGHMFVIFIGDKKAAAGSVGYWETAWQDQTVWEIGWSVLPEFQNKGIATKATALTVKHARTGGKHQFLHAFPSVDNVASNAICKKLGFSLQKEVEFESWKEAGTFLRFNDWQLDLFANA